MLQCSSGAHREDTPGTEGNASVSAGAGAERTELWGGGMFEPCPHCFGDLAAAAAAVAAAAAPSANVAEASGQQLQVLANPQGGS